MTDYNTLQKRHNMIVGAFVIIAFCAFLWLIFIFGELPVVVGKYKSFIVLVNFPNAPGVQKNTPVRYLGYQVGKVIDVSPPFTYHDSETGEMYPQIKVTLAIEKKYRDIPSNVDIRLMKRSMGSSYIELIVDRTKPLVQMDERKESVFLINELELKGNSSTGSEFIPKQVQDKVEKLLDSLIILSKNANEVIGDPDNQENVKIALANIKDASIKANATLSSIKKFSDEGTNTLATTSEELQDTLIEVRKVLAKINDSNSTVSKLINDGRLYENLLESSQELKLALEQLKKFASEARDKGIKINL